MPDNGPGNSFDFEGAKESFLNAFGSARIGAALFDRNLRILAINQALAEMNRKPVESHAGKTLGEIVNAKCCEASSIIPRVFETGKPAYADITAKLATRQDEGTWSASFVPVKDIAGRVMLVTALVVETTHQTVLAEVLRTLLTNLPQVRDKVSWAYLSSQSRKEPVDPVHLVRAAELSEQCVQALQRFALYMSEDSSQERQEEGIAHPILPFDNQISGAESIDSHPPNGELLQSKLTKRELEVVRLLAAGKSSKEIADELPITVLTVQTYRKQIMAKLGTDSLADLTRFAIRNNLIDP